MYYINKEPLWGRDINSLHTAHLKMDWRWMARQNWVVCCHYCITVCLPILRRHSSIASCGV